MSAARTHDGRPRSPHTRDGPEDCRGYETNVSSVRKRCLPISTPRQRRFSNEKDTAFCIKSASESLQGRKTPGTGPACPKPALRSQGVGAKPAARKPPLTQSLLDFDGCDAFELLGDGGRVFLGDVLLQGLGRAVDQVLGFLQAQGGDFANSLDGGNLVGAGILEDDGELGLLFDRGRCCCSAAGCRGCCVVFLAGVVDFGGTSEIQ